MASSENKEPTDTHEKDKPIILNPNAVPYVFKPPAKSEEPTINVDAKPFVPKFKREPPLNNTQEENKHEIPTDALEEFEDDLLEQLDYNEEDQGEWVKECQDCSCCQGWVYNCSGEACKYLNSCYCKIKMDIEQTGTSK